MMRAYKTATCSERCNRRPIHTSMVTSITLLQAGPYFLRHVSIRLASATSIARIHTEMAVSLKNTSHTGTLCRTCIDIQRSGFSIDVRIP